jgi:hypothetical protein
LIHIRIATITSHILVMAHDTDEEVKYVEQGKLDLGRKNSLASGVPVGQENLFEAIPPHITYEGAHRWDPAAEWTPEEERRVVRIADYKLLSWICVMVLLLAALHLTQSN